MNVCDRCGSDVAIMHGLCPGCIAHEEVARKSQNLVVTDNVPAPPIAPAPQWSTTPPTVEGWYWRRRQIHTRPVDYGRPQAVRVYRRDGELWDDFGELPTTGDEFLQWWPVRISEPPR